MKPNIRTALRKQQQIAQGSSIELGLCACMRPHISRYSDGLPRGHVRRPDASHPHIEQSQYSRAFQALGMLHSCAVQNQAGLYTHINGKVVCSSLNSQPGPCCSRLPGILLCCCQGGYALLASDQNENQLEYDFFCTVAPTVGCRSSVQQAHWRAWI